MTNVTYFGNIDDYWLEESYSQNQVNIYLFSYKKADDYAV